MCDDYDDELEASSVSANAIRRRQFVMLSAGAVLAGCVGPAAESHDPTPKTPAPAGSIGGSGASPARPLAERDVRIKTPDGMADAFFVHPAEGAHPAVVVWPDIVGLREVFRGMARKLAAAGYAVLVVNPYYRQQAAPVLETFAAWRTPEGQAKIAPLRAALTPSAIDSDASAFVAFLDAEKAVDTNRGIGSQGYCMGGPFAVRTAAAAPARVLAAASFHGAAVATEAPDSSHRLFPRTKARYLFAIAKNDDEKDAKSKDLLREGASAAERPAEIMVYPAAHGFCVADSPAWDATQADLAWTRLLALYAAL